MPNISSPQGTPNRLMPYMRVDGLKQAAGFFVTFPTLDEMNLAVASERLNTTDASAIWSSGQPLSVASELLQGVHRVWSIPLQHARTVIVRPGRAVILASDTNALLFAAGVPSGGTGAVGDVSVDWSGNSLYVKTGVATWGAATPIYAGGSSGSAGLSGATYDGSNKVTGFTAGGVTYAVTYPTNQIVVTGSDSSVQTINLDGSGRLASVV